MMMFNVHHKNWSNLKNNQKICVVNFEINEKTQVMVKLKPFFLTIGFQNITKFIDHSKTFVKLLDCIKIS